MIEPDKLEVVYYSSPIPENLSYLTFLGLVFDHIHFPNVYIPTDGFDKDEVVAEINRLDNLGIADRSTLLKNQRGQSSLVLIGKFRDQSTLTPLIPPFPAICNLCELMSLTFDF